MQFSGKQFLDEACTGQSRVVVFARRALGESYKTSTPTVCSRRRLGKLQTISPSFV